MTKRPFAALHRLTAARQGAPSPCGWVHGKRQLSGLQIRSRNFNAAQRADFQHHHLDESVRPDNDTLLEHPYKTTAVANHSYRSAATNPTTARPSQAVNDNLHHQPWQPQHHQHHHNHHPPPPPPPQPHSQNLSNNNHNNHPSPASSKTTPPAQATTPP
jgi:hypothetical protein